MEISFETETLREICEVDTEARRAYGASVAAALRARMAEIMAASSIGDLIASPPIPLPEAGKLSICLPENRRLVFAANHPSNPMAADGNLDWEKIYRVKVLDIEKS